MSVIGTSMGKRRIPLKSGDEPVGLLHGKVVSGETDLHGLDARAAEVRLESFLARWPGGAVVRVITGRGNRSEGAAVLRPLVASLLTGRLARFVEQHVTETGGGSILVEIRKTTR